jgi:prepilin-type N-terminal cleavage/methylation domain-containing protein
VFRGHPVFVVGAIGRWQILCIIAGEVAMSRKNAYAFTLIELLIVITIIAVLVSLLAPTLAKARELTRRASCQARLHNLGMGWRFYLDDNNDTFPLYGADPAYPHYGTNLHWCYGGNQPALCENPPPATGAGITTMWSFRPLNPYMQKAAVKISNAEAFHCPSDHGIRSLDITRGGPTCGYSCYQWWGNSYVMNCLLLYETDPVTLRPYYTSNFSLKPFRMRMVTVAPSALLVTGDGGWMYSTDPTTVWDGTFHNEPNRHNILFMDNHVSYESITSDLGSDYSQWPFPVNPNQLQ